MKGKTNSRPVLTRAIHWIARIWAVASIGMVLAFLVGEGFHPSQIQPREWLGLVFFPPGICVGMIVAWWKEGLGGAITVGSLAVFYLIHLATAGTFPRGMGILALRGTGIPVSRQLATIAERRHARLIRQATGGGQDRAAQQADAAYDAQGGTRRAS
jgi:hypothetical protein